MRKPYLLFGMVNGRLLASKRYKTFDAAYAAMSLLMDRYHLQLADESETNSQTIYFMEQYRSWFHIQNRLCAD